MSESRQVLKNILGLGSAELISKAIAVVYTIYFLRIIGPEGNGIINFAKSFVQYFLIFVLLGFDQVGIIEVAKNRNSLNKYVDTIISLRLIIAFVCYISLFLTIYFFDDYFNISDLTFDVILIYGLNLFNFAFLITWVYLAVEKPKIIAVRTIITNSLNLIGIYLFVKDSTDVIPAVLVITLTVSINAIWFIIIYIKEFGKIRFNFDAKLWQTVFKSAFTIGVIWLVITLYHYINITMLGILTTDLETGLFAAAHSFLILMVMPAHIMQSIFFPKFSKIASNLDLQNLNSKFVKLLLFVGIYLSLTGIFYSDLIISVLGDKFASASEIMKYISITLFWTYATIAYFSPLIAQNKSKLVLIVNLVGLIINIISNYFLIPAYGAIGAGISTILCEMGVTIGMTIIYRNNYKHHFTLSILINILIGIIGFTPVLLSIYLDWNLYLTFALSTILYGLLFIGFKQVTIEELRRLLKK